MPFGLRGRVRRYLPVRFRPRVITRRVSPPTYACRSPSEGKSPQHTAGGNGSTAKVTAGSQSQSADAGAPVAGYAAGRLQALYDAATLEQLEAIAAAPPVRQSRAWHSAVLARLTADVHDAAAVARWTLVDWEDYFSRLEVRLRVTGLSLN